MKSNRSDSICLSGMITPRHSSKIKEQLFGYPCMFE